MDLSACACGEGLGQVVHLRSAIGVLIVFLNNLQIWGNRKVNDEDPGLFALLRGLGQVLPVHAWSGIFLSRDDNKIKI